MAEVAASRNADGVDGANRDFYTAGGTLGLGDWFVNAIASGWNENATAGDLDVRQPELSVGRAPAETPVRDVGVEYGGETGAAATGVGAGVSGAVIVGKGVS